MGIRFDVQELMSNSRLALQAGEFARDCDLHEEFHEAVFQAYFTDCLDIGQRDVVLAVARKTGLDTDALIRAWNDNTYQPRLDRTRQAALEVPVKAAPTFVIKGGEVITGAQPVETFRKAFAEVAGG